MTRGARRRRGALLLALAIACGGVAASEVQNRERQVEESVGPLVPVVVARSDLADGAPLVPAELAVRMLPARFAPPDGLAAAEEAAGAKLAAPVAAGGYVTAGVLEGTTTDANEGGRPGRGERALDVAVAAGTDLVEAGPGTRVDVLVTTESSESRGRTYLALEDVELLAARPAESAGQQAGGSGTNATAVATLRVTVRQAVLLTAAQSFAREIRLLVRPPGERRGGRPVAVSAAEL